MSDTAERPQRPPHAIQEGLCDMCREPVGKRSETECDYHAGHIDGYDAHRRYVGRVIAEWTR